jgi:transposase-like protein
MIIIGAEVEGTRIGRVRMRPIRNGLRHYLHAFVEQCVVPGSTIRTDDWHAYVGLARKGYLHEVRPTSPNWGLAEDLGRRKYSEMPRVDWVAGRLKRWLVGTHAGAVSQSQLRYYLDEFTFRFNARRCKDPGKLFERLLQQAVTTERIPYRGVVARSRLGRRPD